MPLVCSGAILVSLTDNRPHDRGCRTIFGASGYRGAISVGFGNFGLRKRRI